MTEESKNNDNVEEKSEPAGMVSLDFDFSPDWARKSSAEITFNEPKKGGRSSSDSRRRPSSNRNDRRPSRAPGRLGQNRSPDRNLGGPNKFRRQDSSERRPYIEMPPVQVRFLPEQNKLSAIARKIHSTKRAYPLAQLAGLVLSSPDSCYLKIESGHDKEAVPLYQCKQCRAVGLNRDEMLSHVADEHLGDFFDKESIEIDAPSGVYVCVAKCGLSGIIIGPPNHHSYNQRVKEIRDAKYPNMSMDDYRQKIVTVKDEETIEKWREEATHQLIYRLKSKETSNDKAKPAEPEEVVEAVEGAESAEVVEVAEVAEVVENDSATMDKHEADKYCISEIAPKLIVRTKVASLPLSVAKKLKDPGLELVCRVGLRRENKFPRSLLLALRAALKHMQLHVFKFGVNAYFVTSVKPAPLDSEYTVDDISEVLVFLKDNQSCRRSDLIAGLRPDCAVDSPEAEKVFTQLHWLVERGHIIEFFDGSLAVSGQRREEKREPKPKSSGKDPVEGGSKPKAEKKSEPKKSSAEEKKTEDKAVKSEDSTAAPDPVQEPQKADSKQATEETSQDSA